eukprot:4468367-Lingulodinium_polyedra.AAC.1
MCIRDSLHPERACGCGDRAPPPRPPAPRPRPYARAGWDPIPLAGERAGPGRRPGGRPGRWRPHAGPSLAGS